MIFHLIIVSKTLVNKLKISYNLVVLINLLCVNMTISSITFIYLGKK